MMRPCQRTRASPPENSPATIPPTAMAATSTPVVVSPPPRYSTPTAGNSTRGIAVIIATRSTRNVMRTLRCVPRYRRPSTTDPRPSRSRRCADGSGGTGGSRSSAVSANVNSTASTAYAHAYPTPATSSAPASGPTVSAVFQPMVCSAFAAGMSRGSSSRGMIADRAGEFTAPAADCTATSPYSSPTCSLPSAACVTRPSTATHDTTDATSATVRRS